MKFFLPLFLIVLVALVGCKKQPEMGSNLLTITAVKSDFDTKATETAFEVGDKIGLYINENVGNLPYETLDGVSWKCLGFLNEFVTGKDYYATAYYPYSESATNPAAIEVSSGIDFLVCPATKLDIANNTASGTLQFKHGLSKLLVTIDTPEEIDGVKTVSLDSIIVKNVFKKATININTNTFSNFSNKGDIVVSNGEAIIIPQTVSRIEFVFKMASGGFSKLAYVKGVVLESGKKTTLNAHSNADLYFASYLNLMNGEAQKDLPLSIYVATGRKWTLTSSETWLTITPAAGVGTGALQTVKVSVICNATHPQRPRAASLTLADDKPSKTIVKVMQHYPRVPTVEIAGTKWLTANLTGTFQGQTTGFTLAANPQDYGMFWKWGSLFMYNRVSGNIPSGHWGSGPATYNYGAATQPTTQSRGYDYANASGIMNTGGPAGDPCKALGAYRTPTQAQIAALLASGKSTWTTYNSVGGFVLGPSASSYKANAPIPTGCIFLPGTGLRGCEGGPVADVGSNGCYWSSSVGDASSGWGLGFNSGSGIDPAINYSRGYAFSARCVQE